MDTGALFLGKIKGFKVEPKSTAKTAADPVLVPCSAQGAKCKKLKVQPCPSGHLSLGGTSSKTTTCTSSSASSLSSASEHRPRHAAVLRLHSALDWCHRPATAAARPSDQTNCPPCEGPVAAAVSAAAATASAAAAVLWQ